MTLFKKKLTQQDDVLGTLKFREDKKEPAESYWECKREYFYNIIGDKNGVSADQRSLVVEIEKRLPSVLPTIQEFIDTNSKQVFKSHMAVSSIDFIVIHNTNGHSLKWEIVFELKKTWECLVIEMKDWKPFYLSISA